MKHEPGERQKQNDCWNPNAIRACFIFHLFPLPQLTLPHLTEFGPVQVNSAFSHAFRLSVTPARPAKNNLSGPLLEPIMRSFWKRPYPS